MTDDDRQGLVDEIRELSSCIERLRSAQEADRLANLWTQVLAVLVAVTVVSAGAFTWQQEVATRQQTAELLCVEVTETRQILVDAYRGSLEAVRSGRTGTAGADQQAQAQRFERLIERLADSRCADTLG